MNLSGPGPAPADIATVTTDTDWDSVVVPKAKEELDGYILREGTKPTLRIMYYLLMNSGTIPATTSSYKKLSAVIVKAKKAGKFPMNAFVDKVRHRIADFVQITEYDKAEKYVDDYIEQIKTFDETYRTEKIPRWYGQDNYVEIWLEKTTIEDPFVNYLKGTDVPLAVSTGNNGFQFFTDNCEILKDIYRQFREHKDERVKKKLHIHILYAGDYDPSGCNMSIYIKANLDKYLKLALADEFDEEDINDIVIDFKRIALNLDQVVAYELTFMPQDSDTMQKLLADSNIAEFSRRLRSDPLYPKIRNKLETNPDYIKMKRKLIDHPKVVQRLKKNAKGNAEKYNAMRADLNAKIMNEYDFMVVELDALAASKDYTGVLRQIVVTSVDKLFNRFIRDGILDWPEHKPESINGYILYETTKLTESLDEKQQDMDSKK